MHVFACRRRSLFVFTLYLVSSIVVRCSLINEWMFWNVEMTDEQRYQYQSGKFVQIRANRRKYECQWQSMTIWNWSELARIDLR